MLITNYQAYMYPQMMTVIGESRRNLFFVSVDLDLFNLKPHPSKVLSQQEKQGEPV